MKLKISDSSLANPPTNGLHWSTPLIANFHFTKESLMEKTLNSPHDLPLAFLAKRCSSPKTEKTYFVLFCLRDIQVLGQSFQSLETISFHTHTHLSSLQWFHHTYNLQYIVLSISNQFLNITDIPRRVHTSRGDIIMCVAAGYVTNYQLPITLFLSPLT